ncbi:hypothetical protein [Bacillus coreaensis]
MGNVIGLIQLTGARVEQGLHCFCFLFYLINGVMFYQMKGKGVKVLVKTTLFIGIDTSISKSSNMGKRKQFKIRRVQFEELSPTVTFACYEKQDTLIRTYFFKDALILFVEVTPFIQQFEEMFGQSHTEMDVFTTDISHEILIPKFIEVIGKEGGLYRISVSSYLWSKTLA